MRVNGSARLTAFLTAHGLFAVVGPKPATVRRELVAESVNWVSIPPPEPGATLDCSIKIRSTGEPVPGVRATVLPGGAFRAEFPAGIAGVAPGQSAVLYDGDAVLGGGFIARGPIRP